MLFLPLNRLKTKVNRRKLEACLQLSPKPVRHKHAGWFICLFIQFLNMQKGESALKAKRKISLLVLMILCLFANGGQAYAYDVQVKPYKDVAEQDWAAESIYRLMAYGVISGYADGTYRPGDELTREAFVRLLVAAVPPKANKQPKAAPQDVAPARWSYSAIKQASDAGWLDALVQDGKFAPGAGIKREEVAALIAYAFMQESTEPQRAEWLATGWTAARDRAAFPDAASIDKKLAPYVFKAYEDTIMQGDASGRFLPDKLLSRREAAKIIDRIIQIRHETHSLEIHAFYAAGGPYQKNERFAAADELIFDWAKLAYEGDGKASLTLAEPQNRSQTLAAASAEGAAATLMVFGNTLTHRLAEFVMDRQAHQAFADSLAAAVSNPQSGYDGVTLDLEGLVSSEQREAFVELIAAVKDRLGSDYELAVAVPPAYYYFGYDYKRLGELADKIILMAYDFTHEASRLPSAPLPLAADAVKQALRDIPADKLVLGISKQANQWTTKEDGTVEFFRSPAIAAVESRLLDPGTHSAVQLPYFLNHMTFSDARGSHELWYEDSRSILEKIRLAKAFELRGIAVWQINQLTDADWSVISAANV
jgi:spore germination protein YaaH